MRNELPISYDKEQAKSQKITLSNQIKCDLRGLDTKVGQITNYATSMMSMLPMFNGEAQNEQKTELDKRIKLCRKLQGEEIDKIKGTTPPSFPKEWKNWIYVNPSDDDIVKAEKYKHNSMVVRKKPYFFIYLYSALMSDYQNFEKNFNSLSWKLFGISLKNLEKKENKNNTELNFLRRYKKYSPVLETDCVMNSLCREIEQIEFDIKFRPSDVSLLNEFTDNDFLPQDKILNEIYNIFKEYKSLKKYKSIVNTLENEGIQDDDTNIMLKEIMYSLKDEYKEKMYDIVNSSKDLFNYLIIMCERYNIKSKDFIWDILDEDIIDIIPQKNSKIITDSEEGFEYLGHTYKLEEINDVNI